MRKSVIADPSIIKLFLIIIKYFFCNKKLLILFVPIVIASIIIEAVFLSLIDLI